MKNGKKKKKRKMVKKKHCNFSNLLMNTQGKKI